VAVGLFAVTETALARVHMSFPGTRSAIAPNARHSMYLVATAKSDTPGAPPLEAHDEPALACKSCDCKMSSRATARRDPGAAPSPASRSLETPS
jgi:hypothetical protein